MNQRTSQTKRLKPTETADQGRLDLENHMFDKLYELKKMIDNRATDSDQFKSAKEELFEDLMASKFLIKYFALATIRL